MEKSISNKKIFSGLAWKAIEQVLQNGFSFIVNLILARILLPEQFGIIGMAVVFIGFIQTLSSLGMNAALIQKKKSSLTPIDYDTAFWSGLMWSLCLFLIVSVALAPFVAWFYDEKILYNIIIILGAGLLFTPFTLVHEVDLNRDLNFKKLAFSYNSAQFIGGSLAILMAYYGFGVWSLVFNFLSVSLLKIPFIWKANPWIPEFRFSKASFRKIFSFGAYTTTTNIFNFLSSNIDYLLIGKFIGASSLGIYTLAFMLTDKIRAKVMSVTNNVMYPVYGKIQDDKVELKKYYLKLVKYNCILLYPIMGVLFIYSHEILLLFGKKWVEASIPLQILSVSVLVQLLANSNNVLIRGMGKPNVEMKLQVIKIVLITVPAIIIGVYYFGIIGAAFAVFFNRLIAVVIAHFILKKLVDMKFKSFLSQLSGVLSIFVSISVVFFILANLIYPKFFVLQAILYVVFLYSTYFFMINDFRKKVLSILNNQNVVNKKI